MTFRVNSDTQAKNAIEKIKNDHLLAQSTLNQYGQKLKLTAKWLDDNKLGNLGNITQEYALCYLKYRSESVSQKILNLDRNALQLLINRDLDIIKSEKTKVKAKRICAYTPVQLNMIMAHQNEKNALSTLIASETGLKAHELFTIQIAGQRPKSDKLWRDDLFTGMDGVIYTVVSGSGDKNLIREVILSHTTAYKLESTKLENPMYILDRGIKYTSFYNISGGNRWSSSFSRSSNDQLFWSSGTIALRYGYAQKRMNILPQHGYSFENCKEIVAQELGAFKTKMVETFLK